MIDVLMYLYETYWRPDACPEPRTLQRKLVAVGFEEREIEDAMDWLEGLARANHDAPSGDRGGLRVYTAAEQAALGIEGVNLLTALEAQGKINPRQRELIVDRVLASGQTPIDVEDLKVMLLIVFWCMDQDPDPLLLDDLFEDPDAVRVYH
jgi:Smg protein